MKKEKSEIKLCILTTVITLVPVIIGMILYNSLPSKVPIHFNANWEVDRYVDKAIGVFVLPVVLAVLNVIVHLVIDSDPKKANASKVIKNVSKWLIPVLSMIVNTMTYMIALGYNTPLKFVLPSSIGLLIVIIGNYLPKCKQNYTVGIRIVWTLNNEDNWNKTHHMAGYIWIICGIIMMIGSFGSTILSMVTMFGGIAVMVVVPFVYSYVLHKKYNY